MIAVWIIGILFLGIGLLVCVPTYRKLIKCSETVKGKIVNVQSSGSGQGSVRANYEYWVDGKRYEKSTGWTGNGIFRSGRECTIKYSPENPEFSYMKWSGQVILCIVGTVFALAGAGVLCLGVLLKTALGL